MKTITEILKKIDSPLTKLINKSKTAKDLGLIFCTSLDADLAKHCHFANYKNSVVTVTVSNTSWATRLRYIIPDIIKNLRVQPEFKTITTIRYIINPQKQAPKTKNKQIKLSSDNKTLWQSTLDDLKKKIKEKGVKSRQSTTVDS